MSQEDSPNNEPIIKEKEGTQRKFGCPCGKRYLSYPALFTHVKQKHQGKPPGTLIKPKTDKARGRPRLLTTNVDEDQSIMNYDCAYELQKALLNKKINYDDVYEMSEGSQTCQDMASQFYKVLDDYDFEQKKIINCFLNYIRFFVGKRYELGYWETHKPTDIIDISNEMVRDLDNNKQAFPIDKPTLIDLLYIMFRWMYKNKWTDHKLIRRTVEHMKQQQMQFLMQMQQYFLQQQLLERQKQIKLEGVKDQNQIKIEGKDKQVKTEGLDIIKQEKAQCIQMQEDNIVVKRQEQE